MQKFNDKYLEKYRLGNNATDEEWEIVKDLLCYGNLHDKEAAKICYKNITENKKWYYNINKDEELIPVKVFFGFIIAFGALAAYYGIMDDIIAPLINFQGYSLTNHLPSTINMILSGAMVIVSDIATVKIINKLGYENDINQLQKSLEKLVYPNRKTSLKDKILSLFSRKAKKEVEVNQSLANYVNNELAQKGSNQDEEIIKRQNEEHASAFVKLVGEDMKSIIANPYPNCEEDLDALHNLANEYVENIIKEQEAKLTSKIALKLSGSKDFYGKLNDLEAKIKRNMEINKMRKYNDGYLSDIIKDGAKAVEQPQQIYNGPVGGGHIPTVEEQFQADLQVPTNDTGSARKLKPNN